MHSCEGSIYLLELNSLDDAVDDFSDWNLLRFPRCHVRDDPRDDPCNTGGTGCCSIRGAREHPLLVSGDLPSRSFELKSLKSFLLAAFIFLLFLSIELALPPHRQAGQLVPADFICAHAALQAAKWRADVDEDADVCAGTSTF